MPVSIPCPAARGAERFDQLYFELSITHFEWARILSDVKYRLYRFQAIGLPDALSAIQASIQHRLDEWLGRVLQTIAKLPAKCQSQLETRMRIRYHFIIGLLYQPSQACSTPDDNALKRCFDSASERISLYDRLYNHNALLLDWPSTHGIFLSGAMLVYCIWSSSEIRASASVADVAKTMRICSNLLTLGGEWWPLARRGRRSFEKLADFALQSLSHPPVAPSLDPQEVQNAPDEIIPTHFDATEWTDIESVLQSFLQSDFSFPGTLDLLDYPSAESFDFGI